MLLKRTDSNSQLKGMNDEKNLILNYQTEVSKILENLLKEFQEVKQEISSIKKESEIEKDNRRIIFPYKNEKDKFIAFSEEELKNSYPKCYSYLLDAKKE